MYRNLRRVSLAAILVTAFCATLVASQTPDDPATPPPVDINSASVEQIEQVVGNDLLAEKIIEGRPYANKRQILTRRLVTTEEYDKIKDRIVARRVEQAP